MKKLAGLVMCGSIIWCSSVIGADAPSLEMGKLLFNNEKLGTSGKELRNLPYGRRQAQGCSSI
jgi:hypothetical protein